MNPIFWKYYLILHILNFNIIIIAFFILIRVLRGLTAGSAYPRLPCHPILRIIEGLQYFNWLTIKPRFSLEKLYTSVNHKKNEKSQTVLAVLVVVL